jgi:hypothetical protein
MWKKQTPVRLRLFEMVVPAPYDQVVCIPRQIPHNHVSTLDFLFSNAKKRFMDISFEPPIFGAFSLNGISTVNIPSAFRAFEMRFALNVLLFLNYDSFVRWIFVHFPKFGKLFIDRVQ